MIGASATNERYGWHERGEEREGGGGEVEPSCCRVAEVRLALADAFAVKWRRVEALVPRRSLMVTSTKVDCNQNNLACRGILRPEKFENIPASKPEKPRTSKPKKTQLNVILNFKDIIWPVVHFAFSLQCISDYNLKFSGYNLAHFTQCTSDNNLQ